MLAPCETELFCGRVRWQDNLGNGVCGLAFDRATIPMNKFLATTLEAQWHAYDARTFNNKSGGGSLLPAACTAG
jgi:WD repeat-containing protein 92